MGATAAIREAFREVSENIEIDQNTPDIKRGKFMFKAFRGERVDNPGPKQYLIKDDQKVAIDQDKNLVENLITKIAKETENYNEGILNAMITEPHEKGFSIVLLGAIFPRQ